MSDFTFNAAGPENPAVAHWAQMVTDDPAQSAVGYSGDTIQMDLPYARRSGARSAICARNQDPPTGVSGGRRTTGTASVMAASPSWAEVITDESQFTARPGSRTYDQPRAGVPRNVVPAHPVARHGGVGGSAVAPSAHDEPPTYDAARANHAAMHGGRSFGGSFVAPSTGSRRTHHPSPSSRVTAARSRASVVHHEDGACAWPPGDGQNIHPDDSVSSSGRRSRSPPRGPGSTPSATASSRTTVSLSDSSVEKLCSRLTALSHGGVTSQRSGVRTVSEEAATTAKNRKKHHHKHVKPGLETIKAGAVLMFGAQEVRKNSRGELVLVKKRK